MKRIISFTIFFGLLLLIFQFVVTYFSQGHNITYSYQSNEMNYDIREHLFLEENKPIYQINVTHEGKTFFLENKTNYNKQKKIISSLRLFEKDGVTCLYPTYQENREDIHDLACIKDGKQYTYTYLKERNPSIKSFQEELMKEDIFLPAWKQNSDVKNYQQIKVYQDNIPKDLTLGIFNYHGLEILSQKEERYIPLLGVDSYDKKGVLANQYYLIPQFNTTSEFTEILVLDITSYSKSTIELEHAISKDCYFQGVVDEKAYLFDRTNKKQYEINPSRKTVREIGNINIMAQYFDGVTWSDRNIYDFVGEVILFGENASSISELSNYNVKEMVSTKNSYYVIDQNNVLYRILKNDPTNPIVIYQMSPAIELQVVEDYVFFISGNTLYCYHDMLGLRPLVSYNEFQYNPKNMYVVYHS